MTKIVKKVFQFVLFLSVFTSIAVYAGFGSDLYTIATTSEIPNNRISLGKGFSTATMRVARYQCFNGESSMPYNPMCAVGLGVGMSSKELDYFFKLKPYPEEITFFSDSDDGKSYLDSIQDTDKSISLSFASYGCNMVDFELSGYGTDALSPVGKAIYKDGSNPNFHKECGDRIFTGITQGAYVVMSIKFDFENPEDRKRFESKVRGSSFHELIKHIGSEKIHDFTIKAMQKGGEPEKLSRLKSNFTACSAEDVEKCINKAKVIFDYMVEDFPKQYDLSTSRNLYAFGMPFTKSLSIKQIGLERVALDQKEYGEL